MTQVLQRAKAKARESPKAPKSNNRLIKRLSVKSAFTTTGPSTVPLMATMGRATRTATHAKIASPASSGCNPANQSASFAKVALFVVIAIKQLLKTESHIQRWWAAWWVKLLSCGSKESVTAAFSGCYCGDSYDPVLDEFSTWQTKRYQNDAKRRRDPAAEA